MSWDALLRTVRDAKGRRQGKRAERPSPRRPGCNRSTWRSSQSVAGDYVAAGKEKEAQPDGEHDKIEHFVPQLLNAFGAGCAATGRAYMHRSMWTLNSIKRDINARSTSGGHYRNFIYKDEKGRDASCMLVSF